MSENQYARCPECGSGNVCRTDGAGTPTESFIKISCENCGYEAWENEERVFEFWGSNELPPSRSGSGDRAERKINEMRDDEFQCPKCASQSVTVKTMAPQSGNSGDYYFFECQKCHYKDDLVDGDASESSCAWAKSKS